MTSILLYHAPSPWRIVLAAAAAVLVHVRAFALASNFKSKLPNSPDLDVAGEVTLTSDSQTSPESEITDTPTVSPLPSTEQPDFREAPPLPRPHVVHLSAPVARLLPVGNHPAASRNFGLASLGAVRIAAISSPRLEYPYEARRQHLTGSGLVQLNIDPASGAVTGVTISKSTGSAVLDNAMPSGFRRWRFRQGTPRRVQKPVTYTLTGASL